MAKKQTCDQCNEVPSDPVIQKYGKLFCSDSCEETYQQEHCEHKWDVITWTEHTGLFTSVERGKWVCKKCTKEKRMDL